MAGSAAPPETRQVVFGAVAEATAADLTRACGPAGEQLVAKEAAGTISPVQQAALDALRPICEAQGMPLAGKPAVPPIVHTVTVQAASEPAPAQTAAAPTTTAATNTTVITVPAPTTATTVAPTTTSSASAEEAYVSVHAKAVAEIDHAVSLGGDPGKIAEARAKLAEAEREAAAGKWSEATTHAWEAIGQARESIDGDGEG